MAMTLHLFHIGTETVSAYSSEDAWCLMEEITGDALDDEYDDVTAIPDDELFTMGFEGAPDPMEYPVGAELFEAPPGRLWGAKATAPAGAWAALGRGLIGSSENW